MHFKKNKWLGLCLFNILFLSSNLLYVSEIVFICIFYNKCVRDVLWVFFKVSMTLWVVFFVLFRKRLS